MMGFSGKEPHMNAHDKLSMRFTALVAVVFVIAVVAYLAWDTGVQREVMVEKALTEARTLNLEMQAAWDYINDSQDAINYNSDGSYDFKHIYCSVAGKNIAQRFTNRAEGYVIRFARENPRSSTDVPDAFERAAIETLNSQNVSEYHALDEYKDKKVFRYAASLEVKNNCLACHGKPAGELDETGFIKEGMDLGDFAGIASIVIPLDPYEREAAARTTRGIVFFTALAATIILVMRFALKRWVTGPLTAYNLQLHHENAAQQDFLTIMSHELRTPLSSIMAFTDIWEKENAHHSEHDLKMVGEIRENSRLLLNMVNNTIDVAKLESGAFSLGYDEVDLVDVLQSITAVMGPLADSKRISFVKNIGPGTPIIVSDPSALQKVFMNIIGNAVKFSPEGGSVRIDTVPCDEGVRVSVSDEGPGIPLAQQKKVFDRFVQATNTKGERMAKGSGLGLFLADTLVHALGGTIQLISAPDLGSTFIVTLPLKAPNNPTPPPPER